MTKDGHMHFVDRTVLLVRGREPFLKWVQNLPDPTEITLEELNRECTVYLVAEYCHEHEKEKLINKHFRTIFKNELASWWLDMADWPATRSLAVFKMWFAVDVHSMVLDLVPEPISRTQY
jgi:hypothetical protein